MARFEYRISRHPAAEFSEVVFFCTADGECDGEQGMQGQLSKLAELLNREGEKGWELVHLSVGAQGIMLFWKRQQPA